MTEYIHQTNLTVYIKTTHMIWCPFSAIINFYRYFNFYMAASISILKFERKHWHLILNAYTT